MSKRRFNTDIFNRVIPFNGGRGKITVTFNRAQEDEPVTIQIYEEIGEDPWSGSGFTAKDFADALSDVPRSRAIDVRINSPGGMVWDGLAIKTLFDEWPAKKTASIDGMAASVASWFMMGADEIRAPKHAQMFIHPAWGMAVGFADDMRKLANDLDKSTQQIGGIYSRKTGMSLTECLDLMKAETLMTAEEAHELGFIDKITEEQPLSNFSETQIANMKSKLAILNSLSASPGGANHQQNQNKDTDMDRKAMIALLNKWGVKHDANATDEQLNLLVEQGKPKATNAIKYKNGKDGDHDDDCDCDSCMKKNKLQPATAAAVNASIDANRLETILNRLDAAQARLDAAEAREAESKKNSVLTWVTGLIESGRLPANQLNEVRDLAVAAPDLEKFKGVFDKLPERAPGHDPLPADLITEGELSSIEGLNRAIDVLGAPARHLSKNRIQPDIQDRVTIGRNAKETGRIINSLKKFDASGNLTGPLVDMWNAWASGSISSPRNANTMSADLLRQVILSEIMRAFKRQFTSLNFFAHTYQNVPLEGNDFVKVPYYPLDTTASTEFTYSAGYVVTPNAQTLAKSILVGGVGSGVATSGSGRKYKGLQFSAYEIRRQPWLNISQLTVMAGEQLAIDVRADIIGTQITKANFGNAIWTGVAGGFDHTVVTQYLQNAAIKAFWPETMRNAVIAPDYYTSLAADPAITPFLAIGTTELLRQGVIGGLYSFQNILYDALVPVSTFIRGGDGASTPGNDPNLCGYICYPSAVLVATAPIMPPPGVLKKLVSYEQVTDDQTGLSITYQYFGLELNNVDNEIIECTYGSGLGEVAALKRLTSSGT